MELLAKWYRSSSPSSSDEETERERQGNHRVYQHTITMNKEPSASSTPSHNASGTSQDAQKHTSKEEIADAAARAAAVVAQRFAARAANATHRETEQMHRFTYQPYDPHRPSRRVPLQKPIAASPSPVNKSPVATTRAAPLFSTLRALPTSTTRPAKISSDTKRMIPRHQERVRLDGHTGAVNTIQWNPRYPPLFLSASMDHSVRVWSVPRSFYDDSGSHYDHQAKAKPTTDGEESLGRRVLLHHTKGVMSAKWSLDGKHLWSGGYDGQAAFVDVETATVVRTYKHQEQELITSVCVHPDDHQLVLCGTDRGRIMLHDLRVDGTATPSLVYTTKTMGEVHDLLFLPEGDSNSSGQRCFVSSSVLTARATCHQTLVVWDVRSATLLHDHLNNDLCAYTTLRLHPEKKHFVAQSTENDAVVFAAKAPFKKKKPKRVFTGGHETEGFRIGCSFNSTGSLFATGDINGRVVFYCTKTQRLLHQQQMYGERTPCLSTEFHPRWPSTLVSGGYDGRMYLFDATMPSSLD